MDKRIIQAMRVLEHSMAQDVDIEGVSAAVGLSFYRFHHLFVEQVGETPAGYLRRIRLDTAAMRLRWTRETVGQIAHGLGYASQASFTHVFRKRYGETPARFRRDFVRWANHPTDQIVDKRITFRKTEGFRCLARRYVGPFKNVPENWQHFIMSLPRELGPTGAELYLGLAYDDPRFTPENQIRYDCCITVNDDFLWREAQTKGQHLSHVRT